MSETEDPKETQTILLPGEVARKIKEIIAEKGDLEIDVVTEDKTITGLGFDSLDTVELAMELENTFAIRISDTELESIETVGDAIKKVWEKMEASKEAK